MSVLGGAEAADALAEDEVELIDAADLIGGIRFHAHAHAAHAVVRARRLVRKVEENAPVVAPEPQPADVEIALACTDDWIAQSGFCVETPRAVVQELEFFRSGPSESIACGGEVGQAFRGQDLPVVRGVILQLPGFERARGGQRQGLVAAEEIVDGGVA